MKAVSDIKDGRTKTNHRAKIGAGVAGGIFLAGVILLVDDKVKAVGRLFKKSPKPPVT